VADAATAGWVEAEAGCVAAANAGCVAGEAGRVTAAAASAAAAAAGRVAAAAALAAASAGGGGVGIGQSGRRAGAVAGGRATVGRVAGAVTGRVVAPRVATGTPGASAAARQTIRTMPHKTRRLIGNPGSEKWSERNPAARVRPDRQAKGL